MDHAAIRENLKKQLGDIQNAGQALFGGREYWWLYGVTRDRKPVLIGAFATEKDAWEDDRAGDLVFAEAMPLPTKNLQKASQLIKQKLRKRGTSTDEALRPMLHKDGLRYEYERRRKEQQARRGNGHRKFDFNE